MNSTNTKKTDKELQDNDSDVKSSEFSRQLKDVIISEHIKEHGIRNVNASNTRGSRWSGKDCLIPVCTWSFARRTNILWTFKLRNLLSRKRMEMHTQLLGDLIKIQILIQLVWDRIWDFAFLICLRWCCCCWCVDCTLNTKTVEREKAHLKKYIIICYIQWWTCLPGDSKTETGRK